MSDLLKPILREGKDHNYVFDVEALTVKLVPEITAAMKLFNATPPTCIRCGEQPPVTIKVIQVKVQPGHWNLVVDKAQHDASYEQGLQFNTAGWRMFDGGQYEALCPECLGFVKTVGKQGGA